MKTLMTKSLILIALGVASSSLASASSSANMTPTMLKSVQIESVTSYVKTETGMKTTMHIEAVAIFTNSCFAPATEKELAIATSLNSDNINYEVNLYQLSKSIGCTEIYSPVRQTINIADILVADGQPAPLILPQFTVNGVKAKTQSN